VSPASLEDLFLRHYTTTGIEQGSGIISAEADA
jgi:hypothetical protein